MQKRIRDHIRVNVIGYVALFLALTGGVAWANHPGGANTISSGDIINNEVRSVDLANGEVKTDDIAANAVGSGKIADQSVKNADLGLGASSSNTIADGGIQGVDVQNNTLTGTQVNESTLAGLWFLGGNAGTGAGDFLGTTDNNPLNLRVNGARALRLEPASDGTNQSPNVIGGSADNLVEAGVHSATIAGGGRHDPALAGTANRVTDHQGTIGGGAGNQAGDGVGTAGDRALATVGGGGRNFADGQAATIGGGLRNTASAEGATVGGGADNTATTSGDWATVGGGLANNASELWATVGGGTGNTASGQLATVGGGQSNTASGLWATVPGGNLNMAGNFGLAAGFRAQASHTGAFVWADSNDVDFPSTTENQFSVRSTGGARFVSAVDPGTGFPLAGVELAAGGGSWSSLSDAASKRAIEPISGREVLRELASVPISTWSYRSQDDSIRHIGPMAQDFFRAFGVGEDRRHIASVDADGVALAAVKGLNRKLTAKVDRLEGRLAALERRMASR